MIKEEICYIGAWGADIQGVNNPDVGEGGIKAFRRENKGAWECVSNAAPQVNAGSMVVSKDNRNIYSTDERKDFGGVHGNGGGVVAYRLDEKGCLIYLNEVSSADAYPCYITMDSKRRYVFVANHGNHEEVITQSIQNMDGSYSAQRVFDEGSLAMLPILPDGSLGAVCELQVLKGHSVLPLFQWTSHPHSVCLDPTEKFLLCGDKGCDLIRVFKIDYEHGKLISVWNQVTEKGSGPRHIVFHPTLSVLYCNSEQNHTVHAYQFDSDTGRMSHLDRIKTVHADYKPKNDPNDIFAYNQTADLKVHKSGNFLYVSNRGEDNITEYRLDDKGKMMLIGYIPAGGAIPRSINFDSEGNHLFVVNQRTGNIVKFNIDVKTGELSNSGDEFKVENPVSIQFN